MFSNKPYPQTGPMVFVYADPPYLGCCRLYGHFHPNGLWR